MSSHYEFTTQRPARHERKESNRRTVSEERNEQIDSPSGRETRKITVRKTVTVEKTLWEVWDERPAATAPRDHQKIVEESAEFDELSQSPERWKLSLRKVRHADGAPVPELEGDYILDRIYSDTHQARWETVFPQQHRLFRASLELVVSIQGLYRVQAELTGVELGPQWTAEVRSLQPCVKASLVTRGGTDLRWPDAIELTPLGMSPSKALLVLPCSSGTDKEIGSGSA